MTLFLIILLNIAFTTFGNTLPAQERYLQANTLYKQGEFAKTYEMYKGIQNKSPELMINMGNVAFELEKFPEAIARWRRAQRVIKKSDYLMLEKRIQAIHAQRSTAYHASSWHKLETRIELAMRMLPQKVWQILFLLLCAVSFFVLSWYKKRYWLCIVGWALALMMCATLLIIRENVQERLMGVALVDTNAYVIKDTQSRVRATLNPCQEMLVKDMCDDWYLVTNGLVTGWVKQNDIQLI